MIFTLGKRNEDFKTGKRNISWPFGNVITLLLLLVTLKQLVITLKMYVDLQVHKIHVVKMFVRAVFIIFLMKLRWPNTENLYGVNLFFTITNC